MQVEGGKNAKQVVVVESAIYAANGGAMSVKEVKGDHAADEEGLGGGDTAMAPGDIQETSM